MTPPGTAGQVVLRLRLIGQMEAWTLTSENVLPAGRKTRALLAVIALTAPRAAQGAQPRAEMPTGRTCSIRCFLPEIVTRDGAGVKLGGTRNEE